MERRLEPAPQRGKGMSWKTFLQIHLEQIAAADFFTVEVLALHGLVGYQILFVMELATHKVTLAGITSSPGEE